MIEIQNVTKRYDRFTALDDVNLVIERHTLTSLIGPNGAGKSTLLSVISRLLPQDGGDVFIEGTALKAWPTRELARKMSILKQSNYLNLRLSVRDLIAFGRFPHTRGRLTPEDERHIDYAVDVMNLHALQHKFVNELSGGERQRAFIAMVIAQNTDYVLLDEPLNNLDMKHAVQIMKSLRRLVDDMNKTVVLVLHDVNFASAYSDVIVAMREGRIVKQGPPEKMIEPATLKSVYDMNMRVREIDCRRMCLYYY